MICKNCGKETNDRAKFCPWCGVATGAGAQADSAGQAPPPPRNADPQPAIQHGYVPPPYNAQPPKKKLRKPLFFGLGAAGFVALALIFALVILPVIRGGDSWSGGKDPVSEENFDFDIYTAPAEPPGGRDVPFEVSEVSFTTSDPRIKMIEVNQGLSYGFDSNTGEFYVLDSFVAGKETAVFITLEEPLDPRAEVLLTIEKDGSPIATLTSVELIDDMTLLFQPRDISEVGFWDQGAYTFTFSMDDSVAVRTTNFYKATPMKVLAVPIKGYYSGKVLSCEGDWKQGSSMLTATYPVAREDVEYVLGPEQDLSDPKYDLNTNDGRKQVWQALSALQPPNGGYTMIVGFMRDPTAQGYLGYTYGEPATIVCESEPDMLATIVHEIAHCYKIGDEYLDGSLNDTLNPPPYGMKGRDILTRQPIAGTKEHVKGGGAVGLKGTGSVIYPEQRAYWVEGRTLLGAVTSYMGGGTGENSFMFWTSSDIWNHLFASFTGQLTGDEAESGQVAQDGGSAPQGTYWGQCFQCFGDVYDPEGYIECTNCAEMVRIIGEKFSCKECGTTFSIEEFTEEDLWIYHPACGYLLKYTAFVQYNTGSSSNRASVDDSETQGEYWGQCQLCFEDVYDAEAFIVCTNCSEMVPVTGDEFSCEACGTEFSLTMPTFTELWIYHTACDTFLNYPEFLEHNENLGRDAQRPAGDMVTVLEIRGEVGQAGAFSAEPWYSYEVPADSLTVSIEGEYSAIVYDGAGDRLSVAYFDALDNSQITMKDSVIAADNTAIPIRVTVKFPENAAKVVIKRGDKEIFAKTLSKATPAVAFTGFVEGRQLSNNTTLTWEATDGDGDSLTYQIWYYRNVDERYLVSTNITGTSLEVDLTDYPGTDRGWFVILATDGVRTGMSESPDVSVPYKAPDILNNIPDGKRFKVTDIVEIPGKVYDAQDGWLWSEGYEWYVDGKFWDNYGNFYFFHHPYMLTPGIHTITLTATNSAGVSSTKDFTIEIIEDESDLPDDWSRNDITLALRLGYYQPLNRLDSPITRIELAKMMFGLGALVQPDDFEHLPDPLVYPFFTDMEFDMTDMNYAYAYYMVGYGLMDADSEGRFNPHASLTEREALQIFYRTIAFAESQTPVPYEVMDESMFIPQLTQWGLFDEQGGPNAYQPGEKLSKRLLMVRIAKFIKFYEDMEDKDYGIDAGFFDNYYKD